jgi:divalent metal cation (Fe/Co/Zn/Cd) transporter
LAGILVGLMVVGAGGKIAWECLNELTESAIERAAVEDIEACIKQNQDVRSWHRLRTRRVGREIAMDVHILLNPSLSIVEGHRIATQLENQIRKRLDAPITFVIHVEPDLPEEHR